MKYKNTWDCLRLDSFDIEIPLSISSTELVNLLQEKNICLKKYSNRVVRIIIESKLFFMDMDFFISFTFSGEKLIEITMSPDSDLMDKAIYWRYKEIQKAMEMVYGRPNIFSLLIWRVIAPECHRNSWWSKDVTIDHCVYDRFGLEERIIIKLRQ